MRERLDCAVFLTRCTLDWMEPLLGNYLGGRLHLHAYETVLDTATTDAHQTLGEAGMALRRYDACLLPVRPAMLSWTRTVLPQAMRNFRTPVFALVQDMTAAGLKDLRDVGISDFLRDPFCSHEARIRIERVLDSRRDFANLPAAAHQVKDEAVDTAFYGVDAETEMVCRNILQYEGAELEAFAMAAASRCARENETFREAKSKVVARFERAYITAALGRHRGNISMAARSAQKHRRAFWELMRKHQITAEPFRQGTDTSGKTARQACAQAYKTPFRAHHRPVSRLVNPAQGRLVCGKGKIGQTN